VIAGIAQAESVVLDQTRLILCGQAGGIWPLAGRDFSADCVAGGARQHARAQLDGRRQQLDTISHPRECQAVEQLTLMTVRPCCVSGAAVSCRLTTRCRCSSARYFDSSATGSQAPSRGVFGRCSMLCAAQHRVQQLSPRFYVDVDSAMCGGWQARPGPDRPRVSLAAPSVCRVNKIVTATTWLNRVGADYMENMTTRVATSCSAPAQQNRADPAIPILQTARRGYNW